MKKQERYNFILYTGWFNGSEVVSIENQKLKWKKTSSFEKYKKEMLQKGFIEQEVPNQFYSYQSERDKSKILNIEGKEENFAKIEVKKSNMNKLRLTSKYLFYKYKSSNKNTKSLFFILEKYFEHDYIRKHILKDCKIEDYMSSDFFEPFLLKEYFEHQIILIFINLLELIGKKIPTQENHKEIHSKYENSFIYVFDKIVQVPTKELDDTIKTFIKYSKYHTKTYMVSSLKYVNTLPKLNIKFILKLNLTTSLDLYQIYGKESIKLFLEIFPFVKQYYELTKLTSTKEYQKMLKNILNGEKFN
ncbi:hypothetical protein BVX95_01965 [archaeon D22]|nr:hypothetical protein BVX95_01965 [archaeon D22]